MISNYLLYLDIIMEKLNRFFEDQREYIFCHKGCSKCCQNAQFPYTEVEFLLLMEGYKILQPEFQKIVNDNVNKIIESKKKFQAKDKKDKFRYNCPFLINNECSVYPFRGLVCRSFGLMTFDLENRLHPQVPFCAYEGLNYSNVLNKETNLISTEKFKELNLEHEPIAHNVNYFTLIDEEVAQKFDFRFGKPRPLIDWFENS